MVRAPCCEKMGLKKGPWTIEEDHILINYVTKYGHGNWRALPRQAGLLRCGKSCRLRWVNYLRPDIKRGNFNIEEQDAIIELHELLGNRWSAIAARLPGRTDNEIKNVWHTHLKKRVKQKQIEKEIKPAHQYSSPKPQINSDELINEDPKGINYSNQIQRSESPQHSGNTDTSASSIYHDTLDNYFPEVDANFWTEFFPEENSNAACDFSKNRENAQMLSQFSPNNIEEILFNYGSTMLDDTMDFWFGQAELPEF